jgi:phage terminase large subunit-like protein
VVSKELRHDGHPVLRWCLGNVAVESDATGNIKPSKKVSTERIDGVIALVMAVERMTRSYQPVFSGVVRNLADFL